VAGVLGDAASVVEAGVIADTRVGPEPPSVARTGVGADAATGWGLRGPGQRDGRQEQDHEADREQQGDQSAGLMSHAGPPSPLDLGRRGGDGAIR